MMTVNETIEKGYVEITTLPVPEATRFIRSLEEEGIPMQTISDDSRQRKAFLTPSIFGKDGGELITLTVFVHEKNQEKALAILSKQLNIVP